MTVLGLTGGSGVGKTTILSVWAGLGAYPVDADALYHQLLRENTVLLDALREKFPDAFVSGVLNRKALGRIVFASKEKQKELESLTHHAVIDAVEKELETAQIQGFQTAAVDALYLLNSPLRPKLSIVVGIVAPQHERIERIAARDGVSRDYAAARIAAQPGEAYYRAHCDVILENNAGPETLKKQAEEIYQRYKNA